MRVIVQQLQLPKGAYDPFKYPNPSLQWFYKILQALALEEDLPEQPEDKTLPKFKQIHKRAGGYVVEWGAILDGEFENWQRNNKRGITTTASGGAKRGSAAPAGLPGTKKIKDDVDAADIDTAMRNAYKQDTISSFKVADLKAWLVSKGASKIANKKADLVDAVTAYFEHSMDLD
jgi:ATP-dependent DNA helicase 2 subunit 1